MPRIALYAGSFDPVTNGHLDVVRHAARLVDRLVIAIGVHPGKAPLFSADERLGMLKDICAPLAREAKCELDYVTFSGLVVEAARKAGAATSAVSASGKANFKASVSIDRRLVIETPWIC